ncbi:sigma-54-dependent transcriptional regulator [Candidatus Magnetaquicoccus inordinatus]|uniref:sigma-54-dependent transcriptional regulator n=1 Tax=Candidatus Magnetaquicoccus inordinatus TaxID=2496818 RepID=UPI00102CBEA3|nr:sigma-54 dependent transcriptional regulator [Candidatus Magnetaquicoccus inordinatus]
MTDKQGVVGTTQPVAKISPAGKDQLVILVGRRDEPLLILSTQFQALGVASTLLADGTEIKQHLSQNSVQRPPSLVVVDVETVRNALELIRELTFLYRGLPVLAAACKGSVADAREAIDVGAADYFLLPVGDDKLSGLWSSFGNQYFDPELGRGRRLITNDDRMRRILMQIRRVGQTNATVLIQGESGTGKELIARFLHQVSNRTKGPFVAINCAALPENLLESELFGHAKGAFTGAMVDHKGKFQQANGGTIFLDEISEMSLNLQAKLLRVLQEREVDPVGGRSPIALDVRVVASTNRDLRQWVDQDKFREDLFYRLNVFPVQLPALRERPKDILQLSEHFRVRFIAELGRNNIPFSSLAIAALQSYDWPGNIRELENVIHRALLMAEGREIQPEDLMIDVPLNSVNRNTVQHYGAEQEPYEPPVSSSYSSSGFADEEDKQRLHLPVGTTVREMEEFLIFRTLDEVNGNRTRAAELLGISIRTLRNKLNEYAAR